MTRRHSFVAPGFALVLVAMLGACQPLSRPFAHQGGLDREILAIPGGAGVFVAAPTTDVGEPPASLVPAIVAALHDLEIVATSAQGSADGPNRASHVLEVRIEPKQILWTLKDAKGTKAGDHLTRLGSKGIAGPAMQRHIDEAAAAVAALIRPQPPPRQRLPVYVDLVDGAPGTGNLELTQAMRFALAELGGIAVVTQPGDALKLGGAVLIEAGPDGVDRIAITWRLFDGQGKEIGTIDQENEVPSGSLDGAWGPTARAIALAASTGLAELLARVDPAP
ncbi:MAG: hypothetical protein O7A03_02110 [Alphaproteobacteria bacterium]|nr:hypothetical protein [Alphaproteobacteria bacterium]